MMCVPALCQANSSCLTTAIDRSPNSAVIQYGSSALWSLINDFDVQNGIAYCAMANGLGIVDVSNPQSPKFISQLFLNSRFQYIASNDGHAHISSYDQFIDIVDISNPKYPKLVSTIDAYGALAIDDSVLAVVTNSKLSLFLIANPLQPVGLGTLALSISSVFQTINLLIHDSKLYVAAGDLFVIDISDLMLPTLNATIISAKKRIVDVAYSTDHLVIAESPLFQIVSHSTLTTVTLPVTNELAVIDSMIFPGLIEDISSEGELLGVALGDLGARVLTISASGDLQSISEVIPSGYTHKVNLSQPELFLSVQDRQIGHFIDPSRCDSGQFYITRSNAQSKQDTAQLAYFLAFDITDPEAPAKQGSILHPGFHQALAVSETHVFAGREQGGIHCLKRNDINDCESNFVLTTNGSTLDIHISESHLILANGQCGTSIFNISHISNISHLSTIKAQEEALAVAVNKTFLYVAEGTVGVRVFDISDPRSPTELSKLPTEDYAANLLIVDSFLLVADRFAGVQVFDITDGANPRYLKTINSGWTLELSASDDLLAFSGASIISIYSHNALTEEEPLIGSYQATDIIDIELQEDRLFLCRSEKGIQILDVSMPNSPVLLESFDTPGFAREFLIDEREIYLADNTSVMKFELDMTTGIELEDDSAFNTDDTFDLETFPNPFNETTRIQLRLSRTTTIDLSIFNIRGQRVKTILDGSRGEGMLTAVWDGTNGNNEHVSSGVYYLRLATKDAKQTKKLMLIK